MFVYQIPISYYQRLLQNDKSGNFKIIFNLKSNEKINEGVSIQKENKIIIDTTINKARVLSKIINEEYIKNQSIEQYVFDLDKKEYKLSDFIYIIQIIIQCNPNEIQITEDKKNVYYHILNILDNEKETHDKEMNINNNIIKCEYMYNNKFNGIISYLKQITYDIIDGSNDHLRITGSGIQAQYSISNLLLFDDKDIDKCYVNWNNRLTESDACIEFDFVKRKINMTSYSIRTIFNAQNVYHPKSWKIMGSNDHEQWELIDMKENNEELNGPRKCSNFECINKIGFYRYIKYIQTENWSTTYYVYSYNNMKYYIGLSAIEFFGSITSP